MNGHALVPKGTEKSASHQANRLAGRECGLSPAQERMEEVLRKFSHEDYLLMVEAGGLPRHPFAAFSEQSAGREYGYLLNRPMHPDEAMLLLDTATLRCYSYVALCKDGRSGRSAALARKLNPQAELSSLLEQKKGVEMHTDYPYEAVYSSAGKTLVGFDGRPEGDLLDPARCVFVRVDKSRVPEGTSPEAFVEKAVRAEMGSL